MKTTFRAAAIALAMTTGVAAGMTAGLTAAAAQTVELKLTHQWKQGTDGRDRAAREFVKEVQKRDPSIKFRIYPGSSLISNPIQQVDALQQGTIEMSVFALIYGVGKVPEFSATILPGAVGNVANAAKLKGGAFHQKVQEVAEANGLHILTWWWTEGGFANRVRPITGPESVKGLKMRGADKTVDLMLAAAGASVFSMPSTELYNAVQTGVLDGLMTSFETLLSTRLYEQTKYATIGGDYSVFMVLQPLVISKSAWDKLTPAQQKAFDEAAAISDAYFLAEQLEVGQKTIDTFKKAGAEVRQMTKAEYDAWIAIAQKTSWTAFEAVSPRAKELVTILRAQTN
ncbi:MAG: TRAP transporter substrate-binding protein DctP [Pseudomonadota bacterium]